MSNMQRSLPKFFTYLKSRSSSLCLVLPLMIIFYQPLLSSAATNTSSIATMQSLAPEDHQRIKTSYRRIENLLNGMPMPEASVEDRRITSPILLFRVLAQAQNLHAIVKTNELTDAQIRERFDGLFELYLKWVREEVKNRQFISVSDRDLKFFMNIPPMQYLWVATLSEIYQLLSLQGPWPQVFLYRLEKSVHTERAFAEKKLKELLGQAASRAVRTNRVQRVILSSLTGAGIAGLSILAYFEDASLLRDLSIALAGAYGSHWIFKEKDLRAIRQIFDSEIAVVPGYIVILDSISSFLETKSNCEAVLSSGK